MNKLEIFRKTRLLVVSLFDMAGRITALTNGVRPMSATKDVSRQGVNEFLRAPERGSAQDKAEIARAMRHLWAHRLAMKPTGFARGSCVVDEEVVLERNVAVDFGVEELADVQGERSVGPAEQRVEVVVEPSVVVDKILDEVPVVDRPGFCYLRAVKQQFVGQAAMELGSTPSFVDLVGLNVEYWDVDRLGVLCLVEKAPGVYHFDYSIGDSAVLSLAEAVVACDSVRPEVRGFFFGLARSVSGKYLVLGEAALFGAEFGSTDLFRQPVDIGKVAYEFGPGERFAPELSVERDSVGAVVFSASEERVYEEALVLAGGFSDVSSLGGVSQLSSSLLDSQRSILCSVARSLRGVGLKQSDLLRWYADSRIDENMLRSDPSSSSSECDLAWQKSVSACSEVRKYRVSSGVSMYTVGASVSGLESHVPRCDDVFPAFSAGLFQPSENTVVWRASVGLVGGSVGSIRRIHLKCPRDICLPLAVRCKVWDGKEGSARRVVDYSVGDYNTVYVVCAPGFDEVIVEFELFSLQHWSGWVPRRVPLEPCSAAVSLYGERVSSVVGQVVPDGRHGISVLVLPTPLRGGPQWLDVRVHFPLSLRVSMNDEVFVMSQVPPVVFVGARRVVVPDVVELRDGDHLLLCTADRLFEGRTKSDYKCNSEEVDLGVSDSDLSS